MRPRWTCLVALVWLAASGVTGVPRGYAQTAGTASSQPGAKATGDETALAAFRAAVDAYAGVRKKIREELPPLTVTPRAAEIVAASDALARAVQRARPRARQGEFFTPAVAAVIRRRLELALGRTDRASVLALINEEPPPVTRPAVHMRFPAGGVLASTPAIVLEALPPLPKELEYRFIGRTLVLHDVEAALILDYLPAALACILGSTQALRAMPLMTTAFPCISRATSVNDAGLAFAMLLGVLCAVIFGTVPAIQLARRDPQMVLRSGRR